MENMFADLFHIEMLHTTVPRIMKKYQDNHDFCFGHYGYPMIFAFCGGFKHIIYHHDIKKLAKIICQTK